MSIWLAVFLYGVLWVVTFIPAWYLLIRLALVAINPEQKQRWLRFVLLGIIYQAVIVVPYIPLLIADIESPILEGLIYGVVFMALVLGCFNLIGYRRIIDQLWAAYANVYDGLLQFYPYRKLLEQVAEKLELEDGLTVLDLGCGTGNLEARLAPVYEVKLTAVDTTSKMLARAKKKLALYVASGQVTFTEAAMLDFVRDQSDASFDRIVMVNSLYTQAERGQLWQECLRVLKPDGLMVVANPDRKGSASIIKEHLTFDSWLKLLHPRFIAIGIIDHFISVLSDTNSFNFTDFDTLTREVQAAGGEASSEYERCYGGSIEGVNILFTIQKKTKSET